MKNFLLLIFFLGFIIPSFSQISDSEKKSQAKEHFFYGKYENALAILSNSNRLSKKDKEAKLLIGICYFQLNRLDESLAHFNKMLKEEKNPYPETWLYVAKTYHARHEFEEAAGQYKRYLKTIRSNDPIRKGIVEDIKRCSKGIELQYRHPLAVVENMGKSINTSFDEFGPVLSPNYGDKLYFSSIRPGNMGGARNPIRANDETHGDFLSDMYSCQIVNGSWGAVQPMHHFLNSPRHDVLLQFNWDGSVLYYFKGWNLDNGEILLDTFKNRDQRTLSSNPFLGPLNTFEGDGAPFILNDTLILFSSSRPGGFGGLDIYKSTFSDGRWSNPKNLGSVINSPFDESFPFLALDEQTLYFSSNNSANSIGGMDVFKSVYVEEMNNWTLPFNLGIPINSASDDIDFKLARDGFTGYFTSSRKDGYGQRDLYIAYFYDFLKEQEPPSRVYTLPQETFTPVLPAENVPADEVLSSSVIKSEYFFPPLLFEAGEPFLSFHKKDLDRITALMLKYPELNLVINAYASEKIQASKNLIKAIGNAQEAVNYLKANGVSETNIFLRGFTMDKPASFAGIQHSCCLEFGFLETRNLPVQGKLPVIGTGFQSAYPALKVNEGLVYKIQVSSVKGECNNAVIENQPYAMIEKSSKAGYYRYTIGAFPTFAETQAFLRKLKQNKKYSHAFIIPFINGKRANQTIAKRNLGIFPDLEYYLHRK